MPETNDALSPLDGHGRDERHVAQKVNLRETDEILLRDPPFRTEEAEVGRGRAEMAKMLAQPPLIVGANSADRDDATVARYVACKVTTRILPSPACGGTQRCADNSVSCLYGL